MAAEVLISRIAWDYMDEMSSEIRSQLEGCVITTPRSQIDIFNSTSLSLPLPILGSAMATDRRTPFNNTRQS
jgi:hypothetical protein